MGIDNVHTPDSHTGEIAKNTRKGWAFWVMFSVQILTFTVATATLLVAIFS